MLKWSPASSVTPAFMDSGGPDRLGRRCYAITSSLAFPDHLPNDTVLPDAYSRKIPPNSGSPVVGNCNGWRCEK